MTDHDSHHAYRSREAEEAVVGSVMLDPLVYGQVDYLRPHHFASDDLRLYWTTILQMLDEGQTELDAVTVADRIERETGEDKMVELGTLVRDTPSAANARAYGGLVHDRWLARELRTIGQGIVGLSRDTSEDVTTRVDKASGMLMALEDRDAGTSGPVSVKEAARRWLDTLDRRMHDETPPGLRLPWQVMNDRLRLSPGDLCIIAARPSMGKTALALNIGSDICLRQGQTGIIFSMEMDRDEQLMDRMMAATCDLDLESVQNGTLSEDDWTRMTPHVQKMTDRFVIDDTGTLTMTQIRSRAQRHKMQHKELGVVIVDYLQLIQTHRDRNDTRADAVSEISRSLKQLAKDLRVPVIALSQLNRSLEQRPDKRPRMADLRESGAIEQDADQIVFIYRDEVYNEDSPAAGVAEIIIEKQRNGKTGRFPLVWRGNVQRFEEPDSTAWAALNEAKQTGGGKRGGKNRPDTALEG